MDEDLSLEQLLFLRNLQLTVEKAPREDLERLIIEVTKLRFQEKNLCMKLLKQDFLKVG